MGRARARRKVGATSLSRTYRKPLTTLASLILPLVENGGDTIDFLNTEHRLELG